MLDLSLFLGFAPDTAFDNILKRANPHLVSMMIGQDPYLKQAHIQNTLYLGKPLTAFPTLDQLEDLEKHLLSLLQKLAPTYNFSDNPLQLLTLSSQ